MLLKSKSLTIFIIQFPFPNIFQPGRSHVTLDGLVTDASSSVTVQLTQTVIHQTVPVAVDVINNGLDQHASTGGFSVSLADGSRGFSYVLTCRRSLNRCTALGWGLRLRS
ncbi:hypothetical protein PoB_006582300 [Plakobranchus ocellatus]|uniref:Uncharacterized protein n=1 Tax=Plakobranchus ocellatus TaxID=259542 RepID=A0AAV4D5C0_9GAST|nr:hypothetical protein PoB_006582300 [Plakobranchus ocellatus]